MQRSSSLKMEELKQCTPSGKKSEKGCGGTGVRSRKVDTKMDRVAALETMTHPQAPTGTWRVIWSLCAHLSGITLKLLVSVRQ